MLRWISTSNLETAQGATLPNTQRFFLLNAPRGTGKASVTTAIQRFLNSCGEGILAIALSAVAAQLLDGAIILHSALKMPIPVHKETTSTMHASSQLTEELEPIDLSILDKIVMSRRCNA